MTGIKFSGVRAAALSGKSAGLGLSRTAWIEQIAGAGIFQSQRSAWEKLGGRECAGQVRRRVGVIEIRRFEDLKDSVSIDDLAELEDSLAEPAAVRRILTGQREAGQSLRRAIADNS